MRAPLWIARGVIAIIASFSFVAGAALPVDRFATCGPPASSVVVGGPDLQPLPANFFFPGSDPFSGTIVLQGTKLGPGADTDTRVRRIADPFLLSDPPGGPVFVPIELVSLSLRSVNPITVSPGAQLWNVQVTLPVVPQPSAQIQVTKVHPNGGTFDSELRVVPRFVFTRISDSLTQVMDYSSLPGPPQLKLDSFGNHWVHTPDPSLNVPANPGTNFFPGVWEQIPGNPASQIRSPILGIDPGSAQHTLCTAASVQEVPTLGTVGIAAALLSLLAAALLAIRRSAPARAG